MVEGLTPKRVLVLVLVRDQIQIQATYMFSL